MQTTTRIAVGVALIVLAASIFWTYRVRAAESAEEFSPSTTDLALAPAGTQLDAVICNGLASRSEPGDVVRAFLVNPVIVNQRLIIPAGAELRGNLLDFSSAESVGKATLAFTVLTIHGADFPIQTNSVAVFMPVHSDVEILSSGFKALIGASLGAAVAAGTEDVRLINGGVVVGATRALSTEPRVPITVIVLHDVKVRREPS